MSHFTVLVVGNDIDKQLAPFNEQPEFGSPYLVFKDCTNEVEEKWYGSITMIRSNTRGLYPKYNIPEPVLFGLGVKRPTDKNDSDIFGKLDDRRKLLKTFEVEVSVSDIYKSKEEFTKDWFGYKKHNGVYGYWHNPNAKWDWYQMGGRWTGYFKLKPVKLLNGNGYMEKFGFSPAEVNNLANMMINDLDKFEKIINKYKEPKRSEIIKYLMQRIEEVFPKTAATGTPGLMTDKNTDPSRADQAIKRDIDVDWMIEKRRKEAENMWDESYPLSIALRNAKTEEEKTAAQKALFDLDYFMPLGDEEIEMGKDEYVKCRSSIATYALLWGGKWYSNGDMGWWGISTNEESQWPGVFDALFEQIPEDELLTVVDCHI